MELGAQEHALGMRTWDGSVVDTSSIFVAFSRRPGPRGPHMSCMTPLGGVLKESWGFWRIWSASLSVKEARGWQVASEGLHGRLHTCKAVGAEEVELRHTVRGMVRECSCLEFTNSTQQVRRQVVRLSSDTDIY